MSLSQFKRWPPLSFSVPWLGPGRASRVVVCKRGHGIAIILAPFLHKTGIVALKAHHMLQNLRRLSLRLGSANNGNSPSYRLERSKNRSAGTDNSSDIH